MARQSEPETNGQNGKSSHGVERDSIVAILPVQLLHNEAPSILSTSPPVAVAFPEVEFEDSSCYLNLDLIEQYMEKSEEEEVSDDDDDVVFLGSLNGKRKAVAGRKDDQKRPRLHQHKSIAQTFCRFHVYLPTSTSPLRRKRLNLPAKSIARIAVQRRTNSSEEGFLSTAMDLYDSAYEVIASLPIINTDMLPIDRHPHRLSNGVWLESLVSLCDGLVGDNNSSSGVVMNAFLNLDNTSVATGIPGMQLMILNLHIDISIDWEAFTHPQTSAFAEHFHRLIRFCFPNDELERLIRSQDNISASLIYSLLPSSRWPPSENVQPISLNPSLYPFQRRSVNFLLGREGKRITGTDVNGEVLLEDIQGVANYSSVGISGPLWQQLDDSLFYNPLFGTITKKIEETRENDVAGGILAEEMGLGKTVEVLALILLNAAENRCHLPAYYDTEQEISISPTKATLIVAPETLRQQWIDEIALHTPSLRVFSYLGHKEASNAVPQDLTWQEWSKRFDIIVVSFDTLRKEINVARKAPSRSRRYERKYERPRSLLTQLAFHRVVMDEVQLVGHSAAAETVSMIERKYSLAVSGTPIKTIKDLKSLFHFLQLLPHSMESYWDRLQSPALLPVLKDCFSMLATRHTKPQVKSEMVLPPQTRVLVPVTFTAIESAFYRDIYTLALQSLGIDLISLSNSQNAVLDRLRARFGEDVHQLHGTLVSLRQACTHPQIAGSNLRSGTYGGTALGTTNTIRSMDEVLTIMIEGTKADQALTYLPFLRKRINRAVLLLQDKDNEARLRIAAEMLNAVIPLSKERIEGVERDVQRAKYVGPLYKFLKSEVESETRENSVSLGGDNDGGEAIVEMSSRGKTQIEREKEEEQAERKIHRRKHLSALTSRWRFFTEELHRAHHFLGNVYFQLGEAEKVLEEKANGDNETNKAELKGVSSSVAKLKKQEDEAYNAAEEVRQRLLRQSRLVVDRALPPLDKSPVDFPIESLLEEAGLGQSGIMTVDTFDRAEEAQDMLIGQAQILVKWRDEILKRLRMPVSRDVSDEDENDDQYQENLDAQSEAEALTEMYRLMLNEREYLLTGVRIEGSMSRPVLFVELERHFRSKERLEIVRRADPENENVLRQLERAPTEAEESAMKLQLEHFYRLDRERIGALASSSDERDEEEDSDEASIIVDDDDIAQKRKANAQGITAIKPEMTLDTILKDIREKMQRMEGGEEIAIAKSGIDKIKKLIISQKSMNDKLKREHNMMMTLFNARSAYFKHIQQLSDDVGDIVTSNIRKDINTLEKEEVDLKKRMDTIAGRLRYLSAIEEEEEGMNDEKGGSTKEAAGRTCFICTEPLIKAVIFNTCGHSTCENCFKSWTVPKKTCPMCKTRVTEKDAYHVTYGSDGKGKKRQVQLPKVEKRRRQEAKYNVISQDLLDSLSVMPIKSALGSKLDLLTRHLLYIEHSKPGTKSLIFTAFSRGITLVGDAFRLNGIKFVTLETGGSKSGRIVDQFKNDPSVNILLLHSEAQSSGLNLNICENVFLLEPLVNHSIELQAIGRVHRIGQIRETTIFIYQVNDTVEERIVHLAAERGQSLVTKENCRSKDLQDSAVMMAEAQENRRNRRTINNRQGNSKRGEFVASMEEIYRCLFEFDLEEEEKGENPASTFANAETSATPIKREDEERERMRRERVMAIERRQAMASLERERN